MLLLERVLHVFPYSVRQLVLVDRYVLLPVQ